MATHSFPKCKVCGKKIFLVSEYSHEKFQIVFCKNCGTPAGAFGGKNNEPYKSMERISVDLKKRMLGLGKDIVMFTEAIHTAASRM